MWWKWLTVFWLALGAVSVLFFVPEAHGFKAYRIVYYHVPFAWVGVLAFLFSAVYSIRYLRKRKPGEDLRAAAAAALGLIFSFLATVSGAIFSQIEWGHFWNWDPRQTTILILLLIYGAYFALRSALPDEEIRGALSAVYAVLAFVSGIFLVFIIPRIVPFTLHPKKAVMEIRMMATLIWNVAGFTGLFGWIFRAAVKHAVAKRKRNLVEIQ